MFLFLLSDLIDHVDSFFSHRLLKSISIASKHYILALSYLNLLMKSI